MTLYERTRERERERKRERERERERDRERINTDRLRGFETDHVNVTKKR